MPKSNSDCKSVLLLIRLPLVPIVAPTAEVKKCLSLSYSPNIHMTTPQSKET